MNIWETNKGFSIAESISYNLSSINEELGIANELKKEELEIRRAELEFKKSQAKVNDSIEKSAELNPIKQAKNVLSSKKSSHDDMDY